MMEEMAGGTTVGWWNERDVQRLAFSPYFSSIRIRNQHRKEEEQSRDKSASCRIEGKGNSHATFPLHFHPLVLWLIQDRWRRRENKRMGTSSACVFLCSHPIWLVRRQELGAKRKELRLSSFVLVEFGGGGGWRKERCDFDALFTFFRWFISARCSIAVTKHSTWRARRRNL